MTGIFRAMVASALAFAMLVGCSESQLPQATGKGTINAINAMPSSPTVNFLIEERTLGSIGYKSSLGAVPYDDLSYNFNFEYSGVGDTTPTRFATQFVDVIADTDYTLVLTGSVTAPAITQWERPAREWSGDETIFEVAFAHLSPALGDVDIYMAPTGTLPVLGEERGKLSSGDRVPEIDLESEDYEVIITARDDPTTILYQSNTIFLAARISYTVAIFDADPSIPGNISVRTISSDGINVEMPDSRFLPTLRTVHVSFGNENFDIYRDEDFTMPIFSDLGFGESTGDVPVPAGIATYTYARVGDPGTIINEESQSIGAGVRTSTIVAGQPSGDLTRIVQVDNRRPVETHAKLRFVHAAVNNGILDLYLVPPGTDITERSPIIPGMTFGFASSFSASLPGSFELILTLPDDKTPLATLPTIDLANGDVVEVIIIDTADPAVPETIETRF
jgi:hypothetical protein